MQNQVSKLYEDWIEMYSAPDYKEKIELQKAMMNRYAEENPAKSTCLKGSFCKELLLRVEILGNAMDI